GILDMAATKIEGFAGCESTRPSWGPTASGAEHPGLMIGLAGVGYFCLRQLNPQVPSVLLLQHEPFGS
ncbi:MAG: hypothetical protein ACJ78Q_18280, partial [Chloroflexia bacterium]